MLKKLFKIVPARVWTPGSVADVTGLTGVQSWPKQDIWLHMRGFGAYLINLSLGSDLLHSNRDNNCKKLWCGCPKAHINPPTTRTEACVPPRGVCAQWKAPPVCIGWQKPRFPMFAGWDRISCHGILHISMVRSIYDGVNTWLLRIDQTKPPTNFGAIRLENTISVLICVLHGWVPLLAL